MTSNNLTNGKKVLTFLQNNIVSLIFLLFVIFGFSVSPNISFGFLVDDVMTRFFRNGLLVVSLIIPVMAGLGLNFGIVVGALASVLVLIPLRYFEIGGFSGLMLAFLLVLPIALLFGYLTGKLYNKTKGLEMIVGLIVGFFAEGLFLIFILYIIGGVIPVTPGHPMIIPGEAGIGVRMSFDMGLHPDHPIALRDPNHIPGLSSAMDYIWRIELKIAMIVIAIALLTYVIIRQIKANKNPTIEKKSKWGFRLKIVGCVLMLLAALHALIIPDTGIILLFPEALRFGAFRGILIPGSPIAEPILIPGVTGMVIAAFCLLTHYFTKTKLGQDCRSVGQNQHIANASGINVDRTRIIATMISTVLASWGMIIFLQNMGTVSTYTAHRQIGMFSVAALLVGGATVAKAGIKNAILGLLLFHAMFVVSSGVGRWLFGGNEAVAEYTRSFMVYSVIGLSLGLHVWKTRKAAQEKLRLDDIALDQLDSGGNSEGGDEPQTTE